MKKTFSILAIAAVTFLSACQKDEVAEPATAFQAKKLADLKEHSGWDGRSDSTDSHGN